MLYRTFYLIRNKLFLQYCLLPRKKKLVQTIYFSNFCEFVDLHFSVDAWRGGSMNSLEYNEGRKEGPQGGGHVTKHSRGLESVTYPDVKAKAPEWSLAPCLQKIVNVRL